MKELDLPLEEPTLVRQDNLGTISWTEGVSGLRRVKHVGIKYHAVRECVIEIEVQVYYTPSAENRADSLTKCLIGVYFYKHCSWMGVTK